MKGVSMNLETLLTPTSFTIFIAALTFIANTYFTWKKYRADLISKARIQWLNEARNISTQLITSFNLVIAEINQFYVDEKAFAPSEEQDSSPLKIDISMFHPERENISNQHSELLQRHNDDFDRLSILFMMYFGPNKENNEIVDMIDSMKDIIEELRNKHISYCKDAISLKEAESHAAPMIKLGLETSSEFVKLCRAYYKTEWVKVKKGR